MMPFKLSSAGGRLSVLCLGAHSDDIEIGAGGTLLSLIAEGAEVDVTWCVMSGSAARKTEAEGAAHDFLAGAHSERVELTSFRDGSFPAQYIEIKAWFEGLKGRITPDLILTHRRDDRHQDHREVCQHTWSTFRNHTILEYEIPKWDGDIGQPNTYVPLRAEVLNSKIELLMKHFGTQRSKIWCDDEVLGGLARLRGMDAWHPRDMPRPSLRGRLLFCQFVLIWRSLCCPGALDRSDLILSEKMSQTTPLVAAPSSVGALVAAAERRRGGWQAHGPCPRAGAGTHAAGFRRCICGRDLEAPKAQGARECRLSARVIGAGD